MGPLPSAAARIAWTVYDRAVAEALAGFDPLRAAERAAVKRNLVRTVAPCALGPVAAFLKVDAPTRHLPWRRPRALREAETARRLRARGVSAPEPLAAGRAGRVSFLLTREIRGAESLHDAGLARFAGLSPAERRAWAEALGRLLASVHRAHLWHPDLHAGNILVSPGPDGKPWLTVADLPSARLVPAVPPRLALRNLAMLAASTPFFSRSDALRALKAYAGGTLPAPDRLRRQVRRVLDGRDRIWETHWLSRTRRCTRSTGAFVARAEGGVPLVARRELPEGAASAAVRRHREILAAGADPRLLKRDRGTSVTRGEGLCVKAFHPRGAADALRRATGRGRARRSWIAANALWERGCATAKPLAWVRDGAEGFLVTEDLSPAPGLDRYLAEGWEAMPPARRRRLLEDLAAAFRRLGERGAWPGDAKACNVLVRERPGGAFEFPLVDVDGVRQERPSTAAMAAALCQLHLSVPRRIGRLSRGRFLRSLLGYSRRSDWRALAGLALRMARGRRILYQSAAGDVEEEVP